MEKCKSVIALGFFDGVHIGHGALLRRTAQRAQELGAVPAAITFDTRPKKFTSKQNSFLLSSVEDRIDLMHRYYGIEKTILIEFNSDLVHMNWQAFIVDFLIARHGAIHLVAGHDFHFGYQGEGNAAKLQSQCIQSNIGCDIISPICLEHTIVSSTYIRSLIAQGDVSRAMEFLGHPHTLITSVEYQKFLSIKLDGSCFNINLAPDRKAAAPGAYAAKIWNNGIVYRAVVYIEDTPSPLDARALPATCLLLDDHEAFENEVIRLEFFHRIRVSRKYTSLEDFQMQAMRDKRAAENYFDNGNLETLPA